MKRQYLSLLFLLLTSFASQAQLNKPVFFTVTAGISTPISVQIPNMTSVFDDGAGLTEAGIDLGFQGVIHFNQMFAGTARLNLNGFRGRSGQLFSANNFGNRLFASDFEFGVATATAGLKYIYPSYSWGEFYGVLSLGLSAIGTTPWEIEVKNDKNYRSRIEFNYPIDMVVSGVMGFQSTVGKLKYLVEIEAISHRPRMVDMTMTTTDGGIQTTTNLQRRMHLHWFTAKVGLVIPF